MTEHTSGPLRGPRALEPRALEPRALELRALALGALELGALEPGQWVRHPHCPDWGLGQIQSVVGTRVTVNFVHRGKVLVNVALVDLERVADPDADPDRTGP